MKVRKPNNAQLQIAQITTRCPSHSDLLLALTRQLWSCGVRSGFRCAGVSCGCHSICRASAWLQPVLAHGELVPWADTNLFGLWTVLLELSCHGNKHGRLRKGRMLQCGTRYRFPCLGHPWLFADAWLMIELRLPLYFREMLSGLLLEAREVFAALQGKCPYLCKGLFDRIEKLGPGVGSNRKFKRQFYKGVFTFSLPALPGL